MTQEQIQQEALRRAKEPVYGNKNYILCIMAFEARGFTDVRPRENVFTYHAWKALGRQVRKGEKSVKLQTYIPFEKKDDKTGEVKRGSRPKAAFVFHIDQTDLITHKTGE